MTNNLVERLRDRACNLQGLGGIADEDASLDDQAADRIEELEFDIVKLESIVREDNNMLRAYHKWCEMNGCSPSSSDLMRVRAALEKKDE